MPKIWFRQDKNAYYLQIDRQRQKRLGKTKAEAEAAYRHWLIEQGGDLPVDERKKLTVAELGQQFLDHTQAHTKSTSYEFYCYFVVPFVERFGSAPAADFSPRAFTRWLDDHKGWKGARRNSIVAVKRLFNGAVENRLLGENPLKLVKRPPKKKRNRVMDQAERDFLYQAIRDEQFREYGFALLETGARPMEVASVTAANVTRDGSKWVFDEHKTDHTGEARIVSLTPPVQELTKKRAALSAEGPIFRSTRKFGGVRKPWTRNGIRCRCKRLLEKFQVLRAELSPDRKHEIPNLTGSCCSRWCRAARGPCSVTSRRASLRHSGATSMPSGVIAGPSGVHGLRHRGIRRAGGCDDIGRWKASSGNPSDGRGGPPAENLDVDQHRPTNIPRPAGAPTRRMSSVSCHRRPPSGVVLSEPARGIAPPVREFTGVCRRW